MTTTRVDAELVREGRAELLASLDTGARTYLLSFEGFSGSPYLGYANAPCVAASLAAVTRGIRSQVVFFFRRQDHFLDSMYVQTLKEGRVWSFDDFVEAVGDNAFDWTALLDAHREVLGTDRAVALPYPSGVGVRDWSPSRAFGEFIGSRVLQIQGPAPKWPNPRYTWIGVELARRCNAELDAVRRRLLREMLERTAQESGSAPWSMPESARQRVIDGYRNANEALHGEWEPGHRRAAWTDEYQHATRPSPLSTPTPARPSEAVLDEVAAMVILTLDAATDRTEPSSPVSHERRRMLRMLRTVTPRRLRRRLHVLRRRFALHN